MTPEKQTEARFDRAEREIRLEIATTKRRLRELATELETLVAQREKKIKDTADFIRALRQDAS